MAVAVLVLFVLSPVVVPGSLGTGPLATMLPFAAILATAAVGQTLVIQQGGVDFSVAGTVSLSSLVLTKHAAQLSGRLPSAFALVVLTALVVGALNALFVVKLRVTPIIATLGVNALVLGAIQFYTGATSVAPAPDVLRNLALGRTFGVHNPLLLAVLVIAVLTFVVKHTVIGRRFEAVGTNPVASQFAGINPSGYVAGAYIGASLLYALAGVMLASFVSAPQIDGGNTYLLASIAAAVLGGTSLAGGAGSLVGAGLAAVFLTQLGQLLLGSGLTTASIFVVQGAVIAISMAARTVSEKWGERRLRRRALLDLHPHDEAPGHDRATGRGRSPSDGADSTPVAVANSRESRA